MCENRNRKENFKKKVKKTTTTSFGGVKLNETANEMLLKMFSSQIDHFRRNIFVIITLVFTVYAPNVLTHSDQIISNTLDKTSTKKVPFVEYYIEHNVSQADAKRSFFDVGIKLLDGVYCIEFPINHMHCSKRFVIISFTEKPTPPWCPPCTDKVNNYCLSGKMLDDHCCCDSRHGKGNISRDSFLVQRTKKKIESRILANKTKRVIDLKSPCAIVSAFPLHLE